MDRFSKQKRHAVNKLNVSVSLGDADDGIIRLLERINSLEDYYTTSSCSGRIQLFHDLGSKIKKNRAALLSAVDMYFDPLKVKGLEKTLKENTQILRYLICSKKRLGETLGRPITRRRPAVAATPEKEKETKKEKVGIEEIDKKLEEILGQ